MNGQVYSVFDVLERWSPSEIPTYQVTVNCSKDEDAEALIDIFESKHFGAEDWSANVRMLCKVCSEGSPDAHDHSFGTEKTEREFGIASPLGMAKTLLAEWVKNGAGRAFGHLREF